MSSVAAMVGTSLHSKAPTLNPQPPTLQPCLLFLIHLLRTDFCEQIFIFLEPTPALKGDLKNVANLRLLVP